jgi:hypothetical protein
MAITADRRAGVAKRVVAACLGTAALATAAFFTAGGALLAPLGMTISRVIVHRRQRTPTLKTSWLGAVAAVGAVVLIVGGFAIARTPAGTFDRVLHTVDSASVHGSTHPPAWARRVAPGHLPTEPPFGPRTTRALGVYGGLAGLVLGSALLSVIIGTIGWAATLPLAYAINGRWSLQPDNTLPLDSFDQR